MEFIKHLLLELRQPVNEEQPEEEEQEAAFLQLNFDCFEAIFDWLTLNDLYALSQTCKKLRQMACSYFRDNITSAIVLYGHNRSFLTEYNLLISDLMIIRRKIAVENNSLDFFHCMAKSNWERKCFHFSNVNMNDSRILCSTKILRQIESVEMYKCEFDRNLYNRFLKYCHNLKKLSIHYPNSQSNKDWLLKAYPKLEHIELYGCEFTVSDFVQFFKKNPNVRIFSGFHNITALQVMAMKSNIKLDELHMCWEHFEWQRSNVSEKLNKLHDQGFYKRLHLRFTKGIDDPFGQNEIQQMAVLKALETLHISLRGSLKEVIDWSPLANVQILDMDAILDKNSYLLIYNSMENYDVQMENLAKSLTCLKRISLKNANVDNITDLVLHSKSLMEIILRQVPADTYLPLVQLNEQRKQITKQKVSIFVDERFYWKMKDLHGNTKLKLVEIKRF